MGSGVSKSGRTSVVQRMPKSVINGPSPASPANVPENAGDQSQGGAGEPGGVTPSEAVPDPNSTRIFTGTYNVNSSKFSSSDIKAFLLDHGAMAADIICMGFQECETCGLNGVSVPIPVNYEEFVDGGARLGETDGTRPRNIAMNDEFLDTIKLSLDNEYVVMGDVAIGEPPTGTKQEVNGKMIEWYGFVRLIVLVRASHPLSKDYTSFKTVIAPFGDKQSMYEPHVYPKDASPDKGGVCVVIESLDLVIVCCHLYGTNKYGVPEKTFDAKRRFQLRHMSEMFQYYLPPGRLSNMNKIVLGDFNFRAEMHPDPEDKVKGGRDWQSVQSHLSKDWKGGSKEDKDTGVRRLFHRHDRLNTWMVKSGVWEEDETYGEGAGEEQDTEERENDEVEFGLSEGVPEVLLNTSDAIAEARGEFCYPTFTFKIGDKKVPREYAEKRTPSWTDRVIYGGALTLRDVGVERKVIASDHEPVYATFLLKQATT